jgi:hypothetical protein
MNSCSRGYLWRSPAGKSKVSYNRKGCSMLSIPIWQLVLFVLAGAALGAVLAIQAVTRGKEMVSGKVVPVTQDIQDPSKSPSPVKALAAAAERQERIKGFVRRRIESRRNLSVDETAKVFGVSPRRIRRLMDEGVLLALPQADKTHRMSAVSVLDLITRKEAAEAQGQQVALSLLRGRSPDGEQKEETIEAIVGDGEASEEEGDKVEEKVEVKAEAAKTVKEGPKEKPSVLPPAGPRQMYWYFVKGDGTPLPTIRDALAVLGIEYKYTGWGDIPASIRKKMERVRVVGQDG